MSGSKGGQQGGGNGSGVSSEMTIIGFVVVACIAVWLIWTKARNVLVYADFGLTWTAYEALYWTYQLDDIGVKFLHYTQGGITGKYNPFEVNWDDFKLIHADIGRRLRFIAPTILAVFGVYAAMKMKGDNFKRKYTLTGKSHQNIFYFMGIRIKKKWLQKLIKILTFIKPVRKLLVKEKKEWTTNGMSFIHFQASHWKVALDGAHFDPMDGNVNQKPPKTPMEWMRDNKVSLTKRDGLDEDAAEIAFQRQLGAAWQGIENAPLYMQALACLWALNVKGQVKSFAKGQRDTLRDRLVEIYVLEAQNAETLVKKLIAPYMADKEIVDAINRRGNKHGFLMTAMIGIYGWGGPFKDWGGGKAGELSTSKFTWIKKLDRTLFFCLNNLGRRAFHIEGAAVVNHFFAEHIVRGPISEAHVDEAMEGLAGYIEDQGILDLDDFFRVEKDF